MTTLNFGNDAGSAFCEALKNIYAGKRSKLERVNGNWLVVTKECV